jgi:predicted ATPase/DNA-binding SARP family transcriptional activator
LHGIAAGIFGGSVVQVRVDVLGPLRLTVAGQAVEVPGPKRRALLALLALGDGRAVPVDHLVDALWPDSVPDSARASLQSHISRLRGHLRPEAARLEGLEGAYRLLLDGPDGGTDVARARALLTAAKGAAPGDALQLLAEARSLWRGPPLAEFAEVAPLAAWAVTLAELRRAVEAAHVAAALDTGATDEAVELATALAADDPLSEAGVILLMRALDAAGRSAEALRCGHGFRRRLAGGTGLNPSPALGELERSIASRTRTSSGGLSRPPGPLHGRSSELAALHRLLAGERLVTVLGPPGVGKTRLAVEAALGAEGAIPIWLSAVTEAAALPHALAAALDLQVAHGDVLPACASLLAAGPHLLLVDNCEHLVSGVRDVVALLLDACPQLTVLATSREPLGLSAEQRFRLAPLPLPSSGCAEDLSRSPAIAVFVERARRVRSDVALDTTDRAIVADIVRRLDGVPLAIELAASRLSSLELADLHDRLDRALDLLGEGSTLRQTIEWSYALLPDDQRRLFRHLAVFPDGFDLPTAETVATELNVSADPALALAHLVDASMLEPGLGRPARYRMLDIVRSFARDQLEAAGEAAVAADRFLRWAVDLAAWVGQACASDREPLADRVLRRELANLRAAWHLHRAQHRLDGAVRMVVELTDAASWRDLTEVWEWALELAGDPAIHQHPQGSAVLGLAAASAWSRGELDRAERLARTGIEVAGDWHCDAALALVALTRGDPTGAIRHGTNAAARAPQPDQSLGVAALAAAYAGDLDHATELSERLSTLATSPTIEACHSYVAAEIDALAGRLQQAEARYQRAITLAGESGATFITGIASVGLQTLRADAGRIADALDGYEDLIDYWHHTGSWIQQWTTLRNLARLLDSLGDTDTACFLNAVADQASNAPRTGQGPGWHDVHRDNAARIRAQAAATDRVSVLEIAREAIARHRANTIARR